MHGVKAPPVWVDHPRSSSSFTDLSDGNKGMLSVSGPDQYSDVWTAQAEILDPDFRQLKFSGLFNGGSSREEAKAAAFVAFKKVSR